MKVFTVSCLLMLTFYKSLAQSPALMALEDQSFDAQFANRTTPKVSGQLVHESPQQLQDTVIQYALTTLAGQKMKTAPLTADGRFELALDNPLPFQQIFVKVGDLVFVTLYANKDLQVNIDVSQIKESKNANLTTAKGITYGGSDGPLNQYMNTYELFKNNQQRALHLRLQQISKRRYSDTPAMLAAYMPIFDSLKVIQQEYTTAYPSPYADLLDNERLSNLYGQLCLYHWGKTMESSLFDTIKAHKIYLVSSSSTTFYRYLTGYIRQFPQNQIMVGWKNVADLPNLSQPEQRAVDSLRATEHNTIASPNQYQWINVLKPKILPVLAERTLVRDMQLADSLLIPAKADIVKLLLNDSKDINDQQIALERIVPGLSAQWCQILAKQEYDRIVQQVGAVNNILRSSTNSTISSGFGKPVRQTDFGAILYNVSGMSGTDFLSRLKKSFAGKAIVFDRWATWCEPCLKEMPHSKQLQQESHDLEVVFVYACTAQGSDQGRWQRKIAELKLPGVHFFIDGPLDAALSEYFSFEGYPGYCFIDRKGEYKPGAIRWLSDIKDKRALINLLR